MNDFNGRGNIGLQLGKPSNWLIDIDLDCAEAIALASKFLPSTEMQSGRKSAPKSHYWYICENAITVKFIDPTATKKDDKMIVELRSTGGQTVVEPSIHPSGEQYLWQGNLIPSQIDFNLLRRATSKVAACAMVARYWPTGARHEAALALSGLLLKAGWSYEDTEIFIISAAHVAGDDELDDRRRAIDDTAKRITNNESSAGYKKLVDIFDKKIIEKVLSWLGLNQSQITLGSADGASFSNTNGAYGSTAPYRETLDGWPEPKPLPVTLLPVTALPMSLIPESLRYWLFDISERLQVPLEYPTVPALVALSSVIGNQVGVRPKQQDDWTVVPNLWGGIVGRPSVMKTPSITEALKPIYRLMKEAQAIHQDAMKGWSFDKEKAEAIKSAVKDKMRKAAKSTKDLDGFKNEFESYEGGEPTERRYIANDTTVEKYGELLNQNPNGLLIYRDELTGWLRSLDKEQNAKDRAFYLETWNGNGSFIYDRIGRGTLKIEYTTTSVIGGIQPGPLESYLRNALGEGEGDDGLMQRFQLLVYPDLPNVFKYVDCRPDKSAKDVAFDIFKGLSEINTSKLNCENDENGKPFLRFNDEAQEFFIEWLSELMQSLLNDENHPAIEAHLSKYRSLMPSLALIFELCEAASKCFDGFDGSVSLHSAKLAAGWCSYLEQHAKRIYGLGIDAALIHAKTLAKHIQKGDLKDGFVARDIYHNGWAGLATAKQVERPLDLLEHLNWVQSVELETGGRPKTIYFINPKVQGGGSEKLS